MASGPSELQKARMVLHSKRVQAALIRIYGEPPSDVPGELRRHLTKLAQVAPSAPRSSAFDWILRKLGA
jgi:hypothetical protein